MHKAYTELRLLLFLLSVTIVWTATGVVVMQCTHTGNISIGEISMDEENCEMASKDNCMKIHVLKLTEINQASPLHIDLQPLQISLLSPLVSLLIVLPIFVFLVSPIRLTPYCWHSPPRRYLQKLTMLLI